VAPYWSHSCLTQEQVEAAEVHAAGSSHCGEIKSKSAFSRYSTPPCVHCASRRGVKSWAAAEPGCRMPRAATAAIDCRRSAAGMRVSSRQAVAPAELLRRLEQREGEILAALGRWT
jgi:hypothetical protein